MNEQHPWETVALVLFTMLWIHSNRASLTHSSSPALFSLSFLLPAQTPPPLFRPRRHPFWEFTKVAQGNYQRFQFSGAGGHQREYTVAESSLSQNTISCCCWPPWHTSVSSFWAVGMKHLDLRIFHPMKKLRAQAALQGTDAEVDAIP